MFGRLFRKKSQKQETELDFPIAALLKEIQKQSKKDPLAGAKIGGKEMLQHLTEGLKDERGVHIESFMCALGALAGYSCQASLRAQALAKGMSANAAFHTIEGQDGRMYCHSDLLNTVLLGAQHSVWTIAVGATQQAGAIKIPDIKEMLAYTNSVTGGPQFGVPRVPEQYQASQLPISYLKILWPALFPMVKLFCPYPSHWPLLFGLAIQEAIPLGAAVLAPDISLRIIMESAIPMSKVALPSLESLL